MRSRGPIRNSSSIQAAGSLRGVTLCCYPLSLRLGLSTGVQRQFLLMALSGRQQRVSIRLLRAQAEPSAPDVPRRRRSIFCFAHRIVQNPSALFVRCSSGPTLPQESYHCRKGTRFAWKVLHSCRMGIARSTRPAPTYFPEPGYFIVSANPLRSRFTLSPVCRPESSRTAPFWFLRTIARVPRTTASPAPAAP